MTEQTATVSLSAPDVDLVWAHAVAVRSDIRSANLDIYDDPATPDSLGFYEVSELEALLRAELTGSRALEHLPIRRRSHRAKSLVCEALGYSPPASVRRVSPRLPHPLADVYVQQSRNLQVWNEEVDASRRYVIVILDGEVIKDVKVVSGSDLAEFDRTGTVTSKFQAARHGGATGSRLVSTVDTPRFIDRLAPTDHGLTHSPVNQPEPGKILSIAAAYRLLMPMVGTSYPLVGAAQERRRGTLVHRDVCKRVCSGPFADHGQFPDVLSQLLEVKLQLSPTVDLGRELPSSDQPVSAANGVVSAQDVRYAVFYANASESEFTITGLVMVTGADFFSEFHQFGGKTSNRKLQLRLPPAWFDN